MALVCGYSTVITYCLLLLVIPFVFRDSRGTNELRLIMQSVCNLLNTKAPGTTLHYSKAPKE